jgi:hypothetical protein
VVADAKYNNAHEEFRPFFFRPITQWNRNFTEQNAIAGEARSLFVNAVVVRFSRKPAGFGVRGAPNILRYQS